MASIEEMIVIRESPAQAMRQLLTPNRFAEWVAPDIDVRVHTRANLLGPGDRLRLGLPGGLSFDYSVEAATERELVFVFSGPWSGEERWSFIPDGTETIARRTYQVRDTHGVAGLIWHTVGGALVAAHFKWELARFKSLIERNPLPAGEIEPQTSEPVLPRPYEVDEG